MLSVLVPFRPDHGHRDRGWEWTRRRWEALIPDAEIIVASDNGGSCPGEFNQPLAINRAAARATGDVFLMLETCFDRPDWVRDAVRLVETGEAPWVLPAEYWKLTEDASEALLEQDPAGEVPADLGTEWVGKSVAGMVVMPREAFELIGGYDERFTWWGAHDVCWAAAMDTLWGEHMRLPGRTFHFWHPAPLEETYGHDQHRRQHALMEKYERARGNPQWMRQIVAKAVRS